MTNKFTPKFDENDYLESMRRHPMEGVPEEELCKPIQGIEFNFPKPNWRWYVFGGRDTKYIPMMVDMLDPPLWHRIFTRIVLRSQWERLP